jgi:type IV secretory pathway VirB10-like protein
MENPIVERQIMKPVAEYTSKGRRSWVMGTVVGGVALLSVTMFFHGTNAKSPRTPIAPSRETADAVTRDLAATSTLPNAAPAPATRPMVETPSPAAAVNAVSATVPESSQVEIPTEEHPGRTKESDQTPAWKGEKTRAILQVVSSRVERVEKEAAELERAGDAGAAASKQVLLTRLKRQILAMNDEIVAYSKADTAERR